MEILIFTLKNFTKLPVLRYLGICNVLYIWHIQAIPTYRVYRLYDIWLACMHAGMENQYMDLYQIMATLYILNQECMMLIIEKTKRRDV